MADKKVSQLTALTGANTASGDLLYIVDVSEPLPADQSKKITLTEFQSAPVSAGTANGVAYLDGSKVLTTGSALTFDGTNFFGGTNTYVTGRFYAQRSSSSLNLPIAGYTDGSAGAVLTGTKGDIVAFGNAGGDGVIFANANTEQMRLTSTGLGIGTSTPATKLDVATSSVIAGSFTGASSAAPGTSGFWNNYVAGLDLFDSAGGSGYGVGIRFRPKNSSSTVAGIAALAPTTTSSALVFHTQDSNGSVPERMRLDFSGNLGLGVTPSGSFKLEVAGGDASIYGITVGRGAGAVSTNTAVGASALAANTTGANNLAIGPRALEANTTASQNTAVGYWPLVSNTTGGNNTSVGSASMLFNTTGSYNTAIGNDALFYNTTAPGNTAVGYQAGYSGTTAQYNQYFGYQAGYSTTTGSGNNAFGTQALQAVTTGQLNVAIGNSAMISNSTGSNNVGIGDNALRSNTTASSSTAVGYQALYSNNGDNNTALGQQAAKATTSGEVTAVGALALTANTTGTLNTAVGAVSLYSNTTGDSNVAVGRDALRFNTTASNNTAVGYQAGYTNSTGADNAYYGWKAGYAATGNYNTMLGMYSGFTQSSGDWNTYVGRGAGYSMTTGSKNTILGSYNGNQGGLDIRTGSNYVVLSDGDGNPRQVIDGSGNVGIGTSSPATRLEAYVGTDVNADNININVLTLTGIDNTGGYYYANQGAGVAFRSGLVAGATRGPEIMGAIYGANSASESVANGQLTFHTRTSGSVTEKMRLDSSGNLGLGVTPSADWSASGVLVSPGIFAGTSGATRVMSNVRFSGALGGGAAYNANGTAEQYLQNAGAHIWYTAPSGTAGNAISFTQAMTLDASGNLGVGATSPQVKLHVSEDSQFGGRLRLENQRTATFDGDSFGLIQFYGNDASSGASGVRGQIEARCRDVSGATDLLFSTAPSAGAVAERARITSVGGFETRPAANGHAVFNEDGVDADFRVESDTNTHALFVEATNSNVKIGGSAERATTVGTNHLDIFDGTAPVGTLANGISLYSSSGEAYVMDAAGNATLFSPHDAVTNEWIFRSKHTPTGKVLKIDVERLLKFVNDHFGLDAVHEFIED